MFRSGVYMIAMILFSISLWGCASVSSDAVPQAGVHYFGTWGTYQVPLKPQEPISKAEAKRRGTYYVGEYDQAGLLVRFDKILSGRVEWSDRYVYRVDGSLQLRTMINSDGTTTQQTFDEKGTLRRSASQ